MLQSHRLHPREGRCSPTPRRLIRLSIDSDDLVLARDKPLKGRYGELGNTHKNDAHSAKDILSPKKKTGQKLALKSVQNWCKNLLTQGVAFW